MSRYDWPARGKKSRDRPRARAAYNAATDGALESQALINARASQPTVAPTGIANVWVPIGPSVVLNGQAGSKPRVTGRVRDIAVSVDGLRVYAASGNGGIWYSGDAGDTWAALGNFLPTPQPTDPARRVTPLTCGCLLVSFGDPARAPDAGGDDVLVGTGETQAASSGIPGGDMGGVGILRLSRSLNDTLADPFATDIWRREASNLVGAGVFRLARDPANASRLLAATSKGLFRRTGPFVEHAEWSPVDFGGGGRRATDVVSAGARLWVAAVGASGSGVWTSTNGADGPFQKVELPGVLHDTRDDSARLGLAVAPSDATTVYVLGSGPRLWRLNGVTPTTVAALPRRLFASDGDPYGQSDYDLAIAVHPDVSATVVVGGAAARADSVSSASLFRFTIAAAGAGLTAGFAAANQATPSADPSFIGNSVHADVHQIRYVKVGAAIHLWVACDGGVFRSLQAGDPYTFSARNGGLAVVEPGFLACHPANPAFVLAGTQDNGLQLRIGDTVWARADGVGGDGGGVVIHPVKNRFFAAQSTNSTWRSNGQLSPPIRRQQDVASEGTENQAASFYSGPSILPAGANVRLAVGSNRVWMAANWDPEAAGATQWVTLPSGRDPRAVVGGVAGSNTKLDVYGDGTGEVIACKWASDNRLWALIRSTRKRDGKDSAVLLLQTADSGATWTRKAVSEHHEKCGDFDNGDIDQPTSAYLPPLGSWSDLAVHKATTGTLGSVYVAATGVPGADRMDTLWWFDGANKWHPTGLRAATSAPAYAVVCDPDNEDIVYVGTALGVWRSVLSLFGGNPQWSAWERFDNGLPEAAVHDIAFHGRGTQKILRAAIASRGVFEVDLSTTPSPVGRTYLRAHPTDARRQPPTDLSASLVNPTNNGPANWPWHASPDVRIRPAPLGPAETIPEPAGINDGAGAWTAAVDPHMLWIFQTALHRTDPLCRADGKFTAQFRARLRALPGPGARLTRTRWRTVVTRANAFADPWDSTEPTEADLMELVVEDPPGPTDTYAPPMIARVLRRPHRVDVLVHHRDSRPVAGDTVRVTLLRRTLPDDPVTWPAIAVGNAFKDAVVQVLTATPPASLPEGWTYADTGANRVRRLRSAVDARMPRAVTFETTFAADPIDRRIMLLAVAHSTVDPITQGELPGATLQEVILRSHHLAARVVRTRRAP